MVYLTSKTSEIWLGKFVICKVSSVRKEKERKPFLVALAFG